MFPFGFFCAYTAILIATREPDHVGGECSTWFCVTAPLMAVMHYTYSMPRTRPQNDCRSCPSCADDAAEDPIAPSRRRGAIGYPLRSSPSQRASDLSSMSDVC